MPFQYAIAESQHPEYVMLGESPVCHPTTQDIAETHHHGVFCVVNNSGVQISSWMDLHSHRHEEVLETVAKLKKSAPAHKDVLGEELAVGDYVTVPISPAEVAVAKVIAFNKSQVRLIVYGRTYGVSAKNPLSLVKIQPNILSD